MDNNNFSICHFFCLLLTFHSRIAPFIAHIIRALLSNIYMRVSRFDHIMMTCYQVIKLYADVYSQ